MSGDLWGPCHICGDYWEDSGVPAAIDHCPRCPPCLKTATSRHAIVIEGGGGFVDCVDCDALLFAPGLGWRCPPCQRKADAKVDPITFALEVGAWSRRPFYRGPDETVKSPAAHGGP